MSSIEQWLLQKILDEATSPVVKGWILGELKALDSAVTNPWVKALIEALESLLATPPPAA